MIAARSQSLAYPPIADIDPYIWELPRLAESVLFNTLGQSGIAAVVARQSEPQPVGSVGKVPDQDPTPAEPGVAGVVARQSEPQPVGLVGKVPDQDPAPAEVGE